MEIFKGKKQTLLGVHTTLHQALYQELNSIFVKLPNVYPEWETNFPELSNQFDEADIQRNEL